jgi:hypothetical protein
MQREHDTGHHLEDRPMAAPLGQATGGRLVIKPAAARLTVRSDATMPDLYRASFESPGPTVRSQGGTVTVNYPRLAWLTHLRSLLGPPANGEVVLNGSIPWHIRVRGGTAHCRFDLGELILDALELGGGASQVELILPTPTGTVPVRVTGGVHDLTVLRPAGVAARIHVGHGAKELTLDDQHFGAVGGSTRWRSPGYDLTSDRYDIAISGGADALTLGTG